LVADLNPRVSTKQARTQNQTSQTADNRPKHHGSETRQTLQVSGRVSPAIKSEVIRLAKLKGVTESKIVAILLEQAIAGNLAEQFAVQLKSALKEAVTESMTAISKANNRAGDLALEAFYSAEEIRVLVVYLLRLILGSDIDVLPQIIKDAQVQARENVSQTLHTRRKMTREIFTNIGETDKQEFLRHVTNAGRGTSFFKFMISPDPKAEDSLKDLDLRYITRRTISKMEKAINRRLFFVAAVHNADHTPLRHVHGIFIVQGRLSKEHFRALQEVARSESTREARLLRQARDLTRTSPLYQTISRNRREAIHGREGAGHVPKVQPGCRNCGFGELEGLPAYKRNCPMCRVSLKEERPVRRRLNREEGRLK
jgi:hypothetical protein